VYGLIIFGVLEKHEDHPRFLAKFPMPAHPDTSSSAPGISGGRLIIGALGDPKTLNPVVASESSSRDIYSRVFSGLTGYNNITQEILPGLAKSWEFSDDKLTLTFHMREGLLWSDGVPLTAYDAEFTYKCIYDPRVENSLADIMRVNGEPFKGVAVDSLTFVVTIPSTFAPFLEWAGAAVPVLPKHMLEPELEAGKFDSAYNVSWPLDQIVGSGPYLIEKYESGVKTVLRRNPNYWRIDSDGNTLPYLERIIHLTVRSSETEMLMFQTGDLDMMTVSKLADVPILEADAEKNDFTLKNLGISMGQNMFWFNLHTGSREDGTPYVAKHKQKWFHDVRFRKAMSHVVDKQGIADTVFGGLAEPLHGPETRANKFWFNPDTVKYDYNFETAGAYLDDMGLIDRDGDGVREDADGNPVEFTMVTNTGNDQRELIGNLLKEDLSRVGVKMSFNPIEFNTLIVKITNEFDYECSLLGLTSGDPDPSSGMSSWLSSGHMHMWHPRQEKPATEWEARIDEIMNLQMTTLDRDKRKEYYDEVQYIMSDMCPYIYLVSPQVIVAYRNKFENMLPSILRHRLLWNVEEVWTE